MDRKLTTGFYVPSDSFKTIHEHIAVMYEDDQGLVAIVGASDETPEVVRESQEFAKLFASSPDLLKSLETIIEMCDEALGEWQSVEYTFIPFKLVTYHTIRNEAQEAISQAKGDE